MCVSAGAAHLQWRPPNPPICGPRYSSCAYRQYNGVPAVVEPRNLVNAWMTPAGHAAMSQAEAQRPLQGCIPDLLTTEEPGEGGGAPVRRLYDLKVINHCPSRYGPNQ